MLDLPLDLRVQAIRVDYAPGGHTAGTHRHPPGASVSVLVGAVAMGVLHSVSANASGTEPASLIAVLVVPAGQQAAVAA